MSINRTITTVGGGWALVALLAASLVFFSARPVPAGERMEAQQLVEKAQLTLQSFLCDEKMGPFRDLIQQAHGVLIVPSLLKGAFVVGASGGSGVLLARDPESGRWSEPAFYTMGGASFGLQIGGQASEVVLLAMTERGVRSFLDNSFKLGGEVGLAAGPMGMGASAATANLSADLISFSRAKGLYGGISLDGAVVAVRPSLNEAYYGEPSSPREILYAHAVTNPQGAELAATVGKVASGSPAANLCEKAAEVVRPEGGKRG